MSASTLPDMDELRAHPEMAALAVLAVALDLTGEALAALFADDIDPLCPRTQAVDRMLHYSARLSEALAEYRTLLCADEIPPIEWAASR